VLVPQITGGVAPPLPDTVNVSVKHFVWRVAGCPSFGQFNQHFISSIFAIYLSTKKLQTQTVST